VNGNLGVLLSFLPLNLNLGGFSGFISVKRDYLSFSDLYLTLVLPPPNSLESSLILILLYGVLTGSTSTASYPKLSNFKINSFPFFS
jgi:hypothetical protein